MPVQTQLQQRRGTAASWTSTNPTLAAGEIGFESDTNKFKIGTGSTAWASLSYWVQDPVTTKGDLYTFSTTDTRLPVGNNGETIVADSSTSTGLRWQTPVQQNPVLNSAFQIWQRGTSITNGGYSADRWQAYGNGNGTVSRQATGDTTNLPNIQYCGRSQRTSGSTSTNPLYLAQNFETINSIPFAGKTVTFSFYARAGANYSPTSSLLNYTIQTGTGTDQAFTGYTGVAYPINSTATLTTTWQRFTATAALSSSLTELAIVFVANVTGTAGANDYFEVTGVQLEVGSVATPFHTYAGTIQGETSACQRYYQRAVGTTGAFAAAAITGIATNSTTVEMTYAAPVQFRIAPAIIDVSGMAVQGPGGGLIGSPSSITIDAAVTNTNTVGITFNKTAAFITSGFYRMLKNNNANEFIAFGAEL
jgi:hypothetical protein